VIHSLSDYFVDCHNRKNKKGVSRKLQSEKWRTEDEDVWESCLDQVLLDVKQSVLEKADGKVGYVMSSARYLS
jgi:hypothetical protein